MYIGKALRLSSRVRSYLAGDSTRVQVEGLMAEAADLDVILTDSEVEALLLESTLVRQHKPRYNIELKDDKSFPYVRISVQEEYPRLSITRQVKADGARYLDRSPTSSSCAARCGRSARSSRCALAGTSRTT